MRAPGNDAVQQAERDTNAKLQRFVDVTRSKRGEAELPKGSNRSPGIDAFRPDWRRAQLATADATAGKQVKGEPWCAWYVTWCWFNAWGFHPLGRQIGGCYEFALEARRRGLWIDLPGRRTTDMLVAAYPGAAVVLLDKPLASGRSEGHTAGVTGVADDGWTVSTSEGNSGDSVRDGVRKLDDPGIRGLILPLGIEVAAGDWPRGLLSGADVGGLSTR